MADEPEVITPPFHTPTPVTHQIASLYVGDLDPTVTEGRLYEAFSKVGTVFSIRVCRDSTTGASLRYAYVNFSNMKDAERALDTLNFTPIAGKPIRIMWSRRDPSLRKSHHSNIFIKNLDKKIDNLELYDLFSNYGNILSCKVATDEKTGESKGYGFVHYETEESAKTAIQEMNGLLFNNKPVYVGKFLSKGERSSSTTRSDAKKVVTNIIVKNIDKSIDQETFVKIFTELEPNAPPKEVTSAVLKKGEAEGEPHKGFGFVNYREPKDAELAIQLKHNTTLAGQVLFVGPHETAEERKKTKEALANQYTNIFINNIASSVTDASLVKLFSEFPEGTPREVTSSVLRQSPKENTQYGFVNYKSHEDAVAAIIHFNNTIVDSKVLFVDRYMKKEQLKVDTRDRNLYITNIEKSVDIEQVFNEFKEFGSIASCKIKEVLNSQYNSAYLCFVKRDDAKQAFHAFSSNSEFTTKLRAALGASVVVDVFLTGEQLKMVNRDRTIHVKNIAQSVTEEKLITLFRDIGTISSCKIVVPKQSSYKTNFGYICFSKPDELTRALATMNNYIVDGVPLEVNILQQKAERRAQLDVTHNVMYKHGPQRGAAGYPDYGAGMYAPQMYPFQPHVFPFARPPMGKPPGRGPYPYPRGGFPQNRGPKRENFNQEAKPANV